MGDWAKSMKSSSVKIKASGHGVGLSAFDEITGKTQFSSKSGCDEDIGDLLKGARTKLGFFCDGVFFRMFFG
jgi:hypothetical protein